jgi:hypothetical protein
MTDKIITPATATKSYNPADYGIDPLTCNHDGSLFHQNKDGENVESCACGMVAVEQPDGTWIEVC